MVVIVRSDALRHSGIPGQKWGVKNGPPYPLKGSQLSPSERKYDKPDKTVSDSKGNKKNYDRTLKEGTVIRTFASDKDRTKDTDMFYANYKKKDKDKFAVFFNHEIQDPIRDENGKIIGYDVHGKYRIDNKLIKDANVASEATFEKLFVDLVKNDRDFSNFIRDPNRFEKCISSASIRHKAYTESLKTLHRIQKESGQLSEDDVIDVAKLFNYAFPYDGRIDNNKAGGHDMKIQRAKMIRELKKHGYSAFLDTNDAFYGGMRAQYPIVVFDPDVFVEDKVKRTTLAEMNWAELSYLVKHPVSMIWEAFR